MGDVADSCGATAVHCCLICPTIIQNKLKPIPYLTRLIKMGRVDGFEPTTAALYSLLNWRLMNENSTAGQFPPGPLFFFFRALQLCRRKYGR